jgi:hypothetical protein
MGDLATSVLVMTLYPDLVSYFTVLSKGSKGIMDKILLFMSNTVRKKRLCVNNVLHTVRRADPYAPEEGQRRADPQIKFLCPTTFFVFLSASTRARLISTYFLFLGNRLFWRR